MRPDLFERIVIGIPLTDSGIEVLRAGWRGMSNKDKAIPHCDEADGGVANQEVTGLLDLVFDALLRHARGWLFRHDLLSFR